MITKLNRGVPQFIEKHLKKDPTGTLTKDEVYHDYHKHCINNGYPPLHKNTLSKALKKLIPNLATTRRIIDNHRQWCWQGITYKPL